MSEYVSRCDVAIDGKKMDDVKNFKRHAVEDHGQVNLMNKTGHHGKTPRHQFSLDYVIPSGERYDFKAVKNKPVIVTMEDGAALEFFGCYCLTRGEYTVDGEKETVQTITFGAEKASDD
jgi:hypothetical protein